MREAVFNVPDLVNRYRDVPEKYERPKKISWHGNRCVVLGTWKDYCAIRFPWHGRYEYELCVPHELIFSQEN